MKGIGKYKERRDESFINIICVKKFVGHLNKKE